MNTIFIVVLVIKLLVIELLGVVIVFKKDAVSTIT